jgi:hypothetical protein
MIKKFFNKVIKVLVVLSIHVYVFHSILWNECPDGQEYLLAFYSVLISSILIFLVII